MQLRMYLKQIKSNIGGNDIAEFIEIQMKAHTLILKFKWHENIILINHLLKQHENMTPQSAISN